MYSYQGILVLWLLRCSESLYCVLSRLKRALDISQIFPDEWYKCICVHSSAVLSEMSGPLQDRLSWLHGACMRKFCSSQQDLKVQHCTALH